MSPRRIYSFWIATLILGALFWTALIYLTADALSAPKGCPPVLTRVHGAEKRAEKAWDAEQVVKRPAAIRRVRTQSRCVPEGQRRIVRKAIRSARADYKEAKATQNAYGDIDPPGASYLAGLRACESGGNYSTNTGNGFYGAYQFDIQTWGSVGGSGLPSDASPDEQDYRAALLWRSRGSAPWPVCG